MDNVLSLLGAMDGMGCIMARWTTSRSDAAGLPTGIVGPFYAAAVLIQHEWKRCEVVWIKVVGAFFDMAFV